MGQIADCCQKNDQGIDRKLTAVDRVNERREEEEVKKDKRIEEERTEIKNTDDTTKVVAEPTVVQTIKMDAIEKFEYSLPFDNIGIGGFNTLVNRDLDDDHLMYEEFKRRIDTSDNQIWKEAIKDRNTVLSRILLTDEFSCKCSDGKIIEDAIDKLHLLATALVMCPSEGDDTEKILFQVLQRGSGGATWIASDDKDIQPWFALTCKIATVQVINFMNKYKYSKSKYTEHDMEKLHRACEETEDDDDSLLSEWVNSVFDVETKLDSKDFFERVHREENAWIFDEKVLRRKVFEKAGVVDKDKY